MTRVDSSEDDQELLKIDGTKIFSVTGFGFWMLPLGVAFIALDIPPARHRIENWMQRLRAKARGSELPSGAETSKGPDND